MEKKNRRLDRYWYTMQWNGRKLEKRDWWRWGVVWMSCLISKLQPWHENQCLILHKVWFQNYILLSKLMIQQNLNYRIIVGRFWTIVGIGGKYRTSRVSLDSFHTQFWSHVIWYVLNCFHNFAIFFHFHKQLFFNISSSSNNNNNNNNKLL